MYIYREREEEKEERLAEGTGFIHAGDYELFFGGSQLPFYEACNVNERLDFLNLLQISYQHDDSETTDDSMVLRLALQQAGAGGSRSQQHLSQQQQQQHSLPGYFQDSLRFELHVNVTPVNDPPKMEIPSNAEIRLAQVCTFRYAFFIIFTRFYARL